MREPDVEPARRSAGHEARPTTKGLPRVVAVVPARDEADVVGRAVASLAAQEYAGEFHIVLTDDGSADGTADVARRAAPGRITVIRGEPLPEGWSGKMWAVDQGVRAAAALEPEYLLLTDADITHAPGTLEALVARAADGDYSLASYMATLECATAAERALIPAFVFFFFLLYPPEWIADSRRRTAGAAGGCILIRGQALEGIGGIETIRGELIDDCALAHAVKRAGGRVWLGLNRETRSIRPYKNFREIGRMISRSAFRQLRHSGVLLTGAALGLGVTYLLPPILTAACWGEPAGVLGAAAWGLMSIAYFPALRYYRVSALRAPLLPLVTLFYMGATIHSAYAYWRGRGGVWKGRVQDKGPGRRG